MSIHPSLNISEKDKKPRSVLKRIERLRILMEKNKWQETDDVFGLPKVKTLRIRIKKEKAETPAATEGQAAPAAGAAGQKEQAPVKSAAAKAPEKK